MSEARVPTPHADWALFLDIDGTLLDIAPRPDDVVVPKTLPRTLSTVQARLGGALALISGRTIDDIDRLMTPHRFPCAAEHGALLRGSDMILHRQTDDHAVPRDWRVRLNAAMSRWPGARIEEKRYNVVVHFRLAPAYRDSIAAFMTSLAKERADEFEVLSARMAFELRHRALNKGYAVRHFMSEAKFSRRVPVFVGDDTTDEDGFRAAEALGGQRLSVRDQFGGDPARVRAWLESFTALLQ